MNEMNLLPWRLAKRMQVKRRLYVMVGLGVITGVLIVLIMESVLTACQVAHQRQRQSMRLQLTATEVDVAHITALKNQQTREMQWLAASRQWMQQQRQAYNKMIALLSLTTFSVTLMDIKQSQHALVIDGKAASMGFLQKWMNQFQSLGYFSHIQLKEIKPLSGNGLYFSLVAVG